MGTRGIPPLTVSIWCSSLGTVFTVLTSIPFVPYCDFDNATWKTWYGVVYAAIFGASIPWTLNTIGAKYARPTLMTLHSTAFPVHAAILSYMLLGQTVHWSIFIGAALILSGVVIVVLAKYRESKQLPDAQKPKVDVNVAQGVLIQPPVELEEAVIEEQISGTDQEPKGDEQTE